MSREPWTGPEDDILRLLYPVGCVEACCAALPCRSRASILERALKRLGLAVHRPQWSEADDAKLQSLWGDGNRLDWIAEQLGRPPQGVYWRARKLGLPCGCPQGHEYFTDAAERTGFGRATMRRILKWAKVPIYPALGLGKGQRRQHTVDSGDVDDAVDRWLETEPVGVAARRHGICAHTLRARLRKLELAPAKRRHVARVTEAEVERALAMRVIGRTLQEAA